jgi:beta-mannanase
MPMNVTSVWKSHLHRMETGRGQSCAYNVDRRHLLAYQKSEVLSLNLSHQLKLSALSLFIVLLGLVLKPSQVQTHHVFQPVSRPHTQSSVIYNGVYVPGWLNTLSNITAFESDAHKSVSIIMWYQGWGMTDGTQNFETSWMNNVRNHGSIPMVTWEPWYYAQGLNQPKYSLQNIINGSFDAYITQWAEASKAWGHPYFLRFGEEMNGNWYPWSEQVNGNKPGQFVQAWQHIHNIFTSVGATNVSWVWAPNVEYNGSTSLSELYPGNAYVDWIGLDGYNWSTVNGHQWQTFSQVFKQTYNDVLHMSTGKPLMVAETASAPVGGNKAAWITDALGAQIPQWFPAIKAVVWFNDNKETDWRIESSASAQAAYAHAIANSIYASNQYANLNVSPIPASLP